MQESDKEPKKATAAPAKKEEPKVEKAADAAPKKDSEETEKAN